MQPQQMSDSMWNNAMAGGVSDAQGGGGSSDALSVSAAMALAKRSLESVTVRILGEVSEVSIKAGYKAAYFTVKDSSASLPCMMWNNRYRASGIDLRVGQLVELTGRFTLYAAKGRMNFDVASIALAGEGDLRLKVANIAKKLQAEGLTNPARKRPLPAFPETIGLVTSPRSAAVHDVLRTLRRRFPVATVKLAGVPVEGAQAAVGIAEGIRCVVSNGCEVVLVVRGGGSFEDMMPFNDEALARTIAACPVPVVTGIGHEVDTSIADMVSDFRASTPTAAAEAVSPSVESMHAMLSSAEANLSTCAHRRMEQLGAQLRMLSERSAFLDPITLFAADAQMLDNALERIARALPANVERNRTLVENASERLSRALPAHFERNRSMLENERARFVSEGSRLTLRYKNELAARAARLNDLSPLAVLGRGYAFARDESGEIVKSVSQATAGSHIEVTVSDGRIDCEVVEVHEGGAVNGKAR